MMMMMTMMMMMMMFFCFMRCAHNRLARLCDADALVRTGVSVLLLTLVLVVASRAELILRTLVLTRLGESAPVTCAVAVAATLAATIAATVAATAAATVAATVAATLAATIAATVAATVDDNLMVILLMAT